MSEGILLAECIEGTQAASMEEGVRRRKSEGWVWRAGGFICPCGTYERVVGPGRGLQGQKTGGQNEARGREGGSEGNAGKEGLCAQWDEATRVVGVADGSSEAPS